MKKYSKLLLSLIVSSLTAGPTSNDSFKESASKKSMKSLRNTVRSVTSSFAVKRGNEVASYGTIYDWAKHASPFESEAIFYNLFGDSINSLTKKSIKTILSVINAKVQSLVEKYKKIGVNYTKVDNLPAFYEDIYKLRYSIARNGDVDRSSEIEDKSLINDPIIQKELSLISGKNKVMSLVKESNYLKLKFYLKDSAGAIKTNSLKVLLKPESFQIVYFDDKCELQFLNQINKKSSISKLKLGIKKDDLKELLGIEVEPSFNELKKHGNDVLASNSDFTRNLFQKLCEYLEGPKQINKTKNDHKNINVINFMNKLINVSYRKVLGNLFILNSEKKLETTYVGFNQNFFPKAKLSATDDCYEYGYSDKLRTRSYSDIDGDSASIGFESVERYAKNILLMYYYEQEAYNEKNDVLNSEKTLEEKKLEIKKIEKKYSEKIARLQKENKEISNNPAVQFLLVEEDNFHIAQAALEKVNTGQRNINTVDDKYKKIQKANPNTHPDLPKSHKVEKTCCGC